MAIYPTQRVTEHRGNRIETEPAVEPYDVADVIDFGKLPSTDTAIITELAKTARQYIEDMTGLAMINQSWKLTKDYWVKRPMGGDLWWDGIREGARADYGTHSEVASVEFPRHPLSSITSVAVYDQDGSSTAVTVGTTFDVDTNSIPGRMALKFGKTWPIHLQPINSIEIVYVAGYGASAADVPSPLITAIKMMAAYLYEHRGQCDVHDAYRKSGAAALADRYGITRL